MPAADKTILKHFLRNVCFPEPTARAKYLPLHLLRQRLVKGHVPADSRTLVRYLHEAVAQGVIFDAGRGWYSSLAKAFILDTAPVKPLADELAKAFPLVTFSCWSTEQVKGAMHHLLSRFATFVNVEADSMESVWEHLRNAGWDAWLNPRGTGSDAIRRTGADGCRAAGEPQKPVGGADRADREAARGAFLFGARSPVHGPFGVSHDACKPGRDAAHPDGDTGQLRRRAEAGAGSAFWRGK